MSHLKRAALAGLGVLLCGVMCLPAGAQPQVPPAVSGVVVLDATSPWRMFEVFEPPVVRTESGAKPLLLKAPWVDRRTPQPPADWKQPDFDDHRWMRGPTRLASATPYLERLCLRGKFTVLDPARARGLTLSATYRGGAIVYVNGQEVARANIGQGAAGHGSADLAEDYPAEAFLAKDRKLLTFQGARWNPPANDPRPRMMQRELSDVPIPAKLLRAGTNVIAVEIVRSAYPNVVDEKKDPKSSFWNLAWDTCQAIGLRLTAATAEGLVPNASRPAEVQVWNDDLLSCDYDLDFGDRSEKLLPIEIVAARNGVFSGKVVVGSPRTLQGLKAVPSDLKGPSGVIVAGQITIRYALPGGNEFATGPYDPYPFPADASLLACLSAQAPEEIPVRQKKAGGRTAPAPGQPAVVPGAVVPIWVTVRVPKDARPGAYTGTLAIDAKGEKRLTVPVEVKVSDWALSDSQDFRTGVEIIESPDTLAMEYNTPLWSPRHWDLIAESMRLLRDSGNRIVYVPLIAETNFGHEQTMVKWIKRGENQYDYDFSVMDKYLDLAETNMGKPRLVVFYVWDVYMLQKGKGGSGANQQEQGELIKGLEQAGALQGKGPVVTLAGPVGGTTENVVLPLYTDPASAKLWKPLFDQLRQRLAKRGLEKAMALGMITDAWPTREEVGFLAEVCPGAGWVVHSHLPAGASVYQSKVAHQIAVWGIGSAADKSLMGWRNPGAPYRYFRQGDFDSYPSAEWRNLCEFAITSGQRGIGRLGGEFWPVLKDKSGQRKARIYARYLGSNWRNLDLYTSVLSPAPSGPAATQHYQHLVEGIQACEARIAIERALSDEALRARIGPDLAQRCQAALEDRLRCLQLCFCQLINYLDVDPSMLSSTGSPGVASHYWFVGSLWQDRDAKLFDLAGEVTKKIEAK